MSAVGVSNDFRPGASTFTNVCLFDSVRLHTISRVFIIGRVAKLHYGALLNFKRQALCMSSHVLGCIFASSTLQLEGHTKYRKDFVPMRRPHHDPREGLWPNASVAPTQGA